MRRTLGVVTAGLLFLGAQAGATGGSGAGNGGDTAERYLVATRQSLVLTLQALSQGWGTERLCTCPETKPEPHCLHLKRLTGGQRDLCRDFVVTTAPQVLRLNRPATATPLLLSFAPLFAPGAVGDRPVAAKTDLGPAGPIHVHYDSLKQLPPMSALALTAHEFGHKVEYGGAGAFVRDVMSLGAFDGVEGGRALLDAAGSAVARLAADFGYVGQYLGVRDEFLCSITEVGSPLGFSAPGTSLRLFQDESRRRYQTGVGLRPADAACALVESPGVSEIAFRVRIDEPAGCDAEAPGRRTTLELWRTFAPRAGQTAPAPQPLSVQELKGRNPVCEGTKSPFALETEIAGRRFHFEVRYRGTTLGRPPSVIARSEATKQP